MRDEASREIMVLLEKIPVVGYVDEKGHFVLPKDEDWDY